MLLCRLILLKVFLVLSFYSESLDLPGWEDYGRCKVESPLLHSLYTLKRFTEGALAKSLHFQFADQAINVFDLLRQLFQLRLQDERILRIFVDMSEEVISSNSPKSHMLSWDLRLTNQYRSNSLRALTPSLGTVLGRYIMSDSDIYKQIYLHFKSVSNIGRWLFLLMNRYASLRWCHSIWMTLSQ